MGIYCMMRAANVSSPSKTRFGRRKPAISVVLLPDILLRWEGMSSMTFCGMHFVLLRFIILLFMGHACKRFISSCGGKNFVCGGPTTT